MTVRGARRACTEANPKVISGRRPERHGTAPARHGTSTGWDRHGMGPAHETRQKSSRILFLDADGCPQWQQVDGGDGCNWHSDASVGHSTGTESLKVNADKAAVCPAVGVVADG